jgi:phage tail-like protein
MAAGPTGVRIDPVGGYNFLVTLVDSAQPLTTALAAIQNVALGGFSECSGLDMTMQPEEHREGGRNDAVLRFASRVTWANIRLRRGVALSDDLWNWQYSFAEGRGTPRDGLIVLQNELHVPLKAWSFTKGLPVRYAGPTLDAAQGRVAIEELEIAHHGLRLTAPGAALAGAAGVSF